jgi:hypothetical protein
VLLGVHHDGPLSNSESHTHHDDTVSQSEPQHDGSGHCGEEHNFDVDVENVDVEDEAITALLEANAVSEPSTAGFDTGVEGSHLNHGHLNGNPSHSTEFADVALEVSTQCGHNVITFPIPLRPDSQCWDTLCTAAACEANSRPQMQAGLTCGNSSQRLCVAYLLLLFFNCISLLLCMTVPRCSATPDVYGTTIADHLKRHALLVIALRQYKDVNSVKLLRCCSSRKYK